MLVKCKSPNGAWSERYRPTTVDECIIPSRIKKILKEQIRRDELENMLLYGEPGMGKTTIAYALSNDYGIEPHFVNASSEGNKIETIRDVEHTYARTLSITGKRKVVIMDEIDGTRQEGIQTALRAMVEAVSDNCSFIYTCNKPEKLTDAMFSRCSHIELKFDHDIIEEGTDLPEYQAMQVKFYQRVLEILKLEKVDVSTEEDNKLLIKVITKFFPDFRKTLNMLSLYCIDGKISPFILTGGISTTSFEQLKEAMRSSNGRAVREWVALNKNLPLSVLIRVMYDEIDTFISRESIIDILPMFGGYLDKAGRTPDMEITTMAMLADIMVKCRFI
jgi:DNA polymerase III delta prime subunit